MPAGSKTGAFNGTTSQCASIIIDYSYTQDESRNTTSLTVSLKIRRDKSGTTTHKSATPYSLSVDGTTKSGSYDFDITDISVGASRTITSITKTLVHNSDGTYKNVSIAAKFDVSGTTLGTGTVNTVLAINAIPRATAPETGNSSAYMGDTIQFTLNRASDKFTHTLTYSFMSASGTIGENLTTSASWKIPDMAAEIPDSTGGACTITCTTFSGSTVIGTRSATITLKIPDSIVPVVGLSISEAAETVAKTGVFVKGLSRLKITAAGSGTSGSRIVSCGIKVGDITYNTDSLTTDTITTAGDLTVTANVTDSRGRIAYAQTIVKIYDYTRPVINAFKVERTTAAYVSITLKGGVTALNGNTPTYLLGYKKKGADAFISQNLGYTDTSIDKVITLGNIDPDYQYTFMLTVQDQFSETSISYDIGTEFTLIDYNASGGGMAIGKVSEEPNMLEINLPIKFNGNVLADLVYPIGSIYTSVNSTNPASYFGGTWVSWGAGRVLVGVNSSDSDLNAPEKTGGEKTHTLTAQEMPAHTHAARYKGFTSVTASSSGYMFLRRNESADNYDGTDSDAAMTAGGGQAHNNMPPYITCYFWKRTA